MMKVLSESHMVGFEILVMLLSLARCTFFTVGVNKACNKTTIRVERTSEKLNAIEFIVESKS